MSQYNHTPLSTGAAANAATFNTAFGELDAAIKKNNYAATAAPTTGDDTADGYSVGSRWIDTTNDIAYIALDVTLGAAIWQRSSIPIAGGALYLNDTSNVKNTNGLTINQLGADNSILSLKSTDVAHGMTSDAEADTYGSFGKLHATEGGVLFDAYTTTTEAIILEPRATTENSTRSTSGRAYCRLAPQFKSGTTVTAPSADVNLFAVSASGATRFILDSDGDSHQDVGTAWTNFDTHDDVALLNLLSAHVTRKDDPLRANFGDWLAQNRTELERIKLVQFNDDTDGRAFVNMSKLTMLLVGAVRQLAAQMETLKLDYANALAARN